MAVMADSLFAVAKKKGGRAYMKKVWKKIKEWIPLWCLILFAFFILALIVEAVSKRSQPLADFIHNTSGVVIRAVLAWCTNLIPFSVAEYLLLASPILVGLICYAIIRRGRRSAVQGVRCFAGFLSIISLVYTLFIFGYGTGYYGETVDEKLGLDRHDVSAEEL